MVDRCTHLAYRKGEADQPPPVHRRARALSQQPTSETWENGKSEAPEITMRTSQKLPNLHRWDAGYLLTGVDLYRDNFFSLHGQTLSRPVASTST